jgi:hypothetical protein
MMATAKEGEGEAHLKSKWIQLLYVNGHSAQSDLFWSLHFSIALCHGGDSLYLGSIN